MCALWGVAGNAVGTNSTIDNFKFLAILAGTRGLDSTGMCIIERRKDKFLDSCSRQMDNPTSFICDWETKRDLNKMKNPTVLMGHARWATLGAINLHNAHPIEHENIILCHNGTIPHFLEDRKDEHNSDSHELARRLAKNRMQAVREIGSGAAAITFVDLQSKSLVLFRNKERPLCLMYTKVKHQLYWASEMWMLHALQTRENPDYFDKPFVLKADALCSFALGTTECKVRLLHEEKKEPEQLPIIGPPKKPIIFCRWCQKATDICDCDTRAHTVPDVNPGMGAKEKKIAHAYRGWDGEVLEIAKVAPLLQEGCCNCKTRKHVGNRVHWLSNAHFACDDCFDNDPMVKNYLVGKQTYEGQIVRAN